MLDYFTWGRIVDNWISWGIGTIISIIVAVWIYGDANARGKSGIVWGIFGFFFSLITLIVWLIVRPKQRAF